MNLRINPLSMLPVLFGAASLVGCAASNPTPELVNARNAYVDAVQGTANKYEPDRVLSAKQALDRAEAVHEDEPGSMEEKHFAYIALRMAETASVYGNAAAAREQESRAKQEYASTQDVLRTSAEKDLQSQRQLTAEQARELEKERAARQQLEGRLKTALESLREMAMVKEEQRGLVITLNGSVLFATGKSELLPTAKERLAEVAVALKDAKPDQVFTVEGHTDSVGSDIDNQKLSQARAEAVRAFLVSQGVASDRITAVGQGEARPIADNNSPEGRANNRRVEIVIGAPPAMRRESASR